MWLSKHKRNNSLVVFLHGLLGDRMSTWKFIPDLLQLANSKEALLRSYDYYLFGYESAVTSQPRLDPYVVQDLDRFLTEQYSKYQSVILIGHSQGGILAKLYLIDKLEKSFGDKIMVDLVITIGTPHAGTGSLATRPLNWLHRTPVIGRFVGLKQVGDLSPGSAMIGKLNDKWNSKIVSVQPCAPQPKYRHIRSVALVGAHDRVVKDASAAGGKVDNAHSCVLPHIMANGTAEQHRRLVNILSNELRLNRSPVALINEIKRIRYDDSLRAQFFLDNAVSVGSVVQKLQPHMPIKGTEVKTASLLWDFLERFGERPLRGYELSNAVQEYASRDFAPES